MLRLSELTRLQNSKNKCSHQCAIRRFNSLNKHEFENQYATHIIPSFLSQNFVCPLDKANKTSIDGRNKFWMSRIIANADKSLLVACGAIHSVGKYGLPALLSYEGYQLQPIIKKMPLSNKSILHRMFQSSYLFFPTTQKEKQQALLAKNQSP